VSTRGRGNKQTSAKQKICGGGNAAPTRRAVKVSYSMSKEPGAQGEGDRTEGAS